MKVSGTSEITNLLNRSRPNRHENAKTAEPIVDEVDSAGVEVTTPWVANPNITLLEDLLPTTWATAHKPLIAHPPDKVSMAKCSSLEPKEAAAVTMPPTITIACRFPTAYRDSHLCSRLSLATTNTPFLL